jgi:FtsH-binding integral membrane protein
MSTLTQQRDVSWRARAEQFAPFVAVALVLALSVAEFINLIGRHTVGAETYGLLVAGLAVVAGILSLGLVRSPQQRGIAIAAVLVLWAIVALGGLAGTYYHIVGVSPEYSPIDPRPRPVLAPLVFTLYGIVGGSALFFGSRAAHRRARNQEEE